MIKIAKSYKIIDYNKRDNDIEDKELKKRLLISINK